VLLLMQTGNKPDHEKIWQPDVFADEYPVDVHLAAARLAQKQNRRHVAKQEYELVLKKSSKFRPGLLYRGQAHLGLAMLARAEQDKQRAIQQVKASIVLLREVGSPRLLAHALLFYGQLDADIDDRRNALQRALVIYQQMEDGRGERDCLMTLVQVETQVGNTQAVRTYQSRLNKL
jgi:tetratricopeptide (TPR) repeat protein